MKIVLFEDKLGITENYSSIWNGLLLSAGLISANVVRRSAWRVFGNRMQLLTTKGNRKAPGFNPDFRVQAILRDWVRLELKTHKPDICICMDSSLLFLFNPDWDQATIEKLRGGAYIFEGIIFVVTFPINAWHQKKKQRDIARLNDGYDDRDEWEEAHGGDEIDAESPQSIWLDLIQVPYGQFVLRSDIQKTARILRNADRLKHWR